MRRQQTVDFYRFFETVINAITRHLSQTLSLYNFLCIEGLVINNLSLLSDLHQHEAHLGL